MRLPWRRRRITIELRSADKRLTGLSVTINGACIATINLRNGIWSYKPGVTVIQRPEGT